VVNEPVGQGFVASLAHPGGNITGFSLIEVEMVGKWMELLKQMVPRVQRATLLFNPLTAPYYGSVLRELGTIPAGLKIELATTTVQNKDEIEQVVASTASDPGNGLITGADSFIVANRAFIIGLANRYHIPAIYQFRQFAVDGGLMSYGPDTADIFRRSASYVDRILKVQSLPIFQFRSRPSSSWLSILKLRQRWASPCHQHSLPALTRSSNDKSRNPGQQDDVELNLRWSTR
jgi:putative ABC transport system substrate-binding protein